MFRVTAISFAAICLAGAAAAELAPDEIQWNDDGGISASLSGAPGDAESGKVVMTTNALGNCVACHSVSTMPDVPFQGNIAPELGGAASRWTEAQLRGILVDAKHTFPESFMPGMYKVGPFVRPGVAYTGKGPESPGDIKPILTAQQVEDVVAYLMTLTE